MSPFYNPYQSNGGGKGGFDLGQGMTDIIQQVMQMLMIKKMGGQGQPQDGATNDPGMGLGTSMPGGMTSPGQPPGMGLQGMAGSGPSPSGLSPDIIQKIMAMLRMGMGGGMGGMGGGFGR